jgi:hypothetical protein
VYALTKPVKYMAVLMMPWTLRVVVPTSDMSGLVLNSAIGFPLELMRIIAADGIRRRCPRDLDRRGRRRWYPT